MIFGHVCNAACEDDDQDGMFLRWWMENKADSIERRQLMAQ